MVGVKDLFGVSEEELEKTEKIIPSFNYGDYLKNNAFVEFEFSESAPREIEVPDDEEKTGKRKAKVITITFLGTEYTLWLSAKTVRMGVAQIWKNNNGDLTGVKVRMTCSKAKHEKYGEYTAYGLQEIKEDRELEVA